MQTECVQKSREPFHDEEDDDRQDGKRSEQEEQDDDLDPLRDLEGECEPLTEQHRPQNLRQLYKTQQLSGSSYLKRWFRFNSAFI